MIFSICAFVFDDKRIMTAFLAFWTTLSSVVFLSIMIEDGSTFLSFGPNDNTVLMGVNLDTWGKWWCVAIYTFVSTGIAAFSGDALVPWITNTIQDHKTRYIPYGKCSCLLIIQVFTIYAVIMSVIGMFVALTQVDFMLIRITADMIVNCFTTEWFLRKKIVDKDKYDDDNQSFFSLRELNEETGTREGAYDMEAAERSREAKKSDEGRMFSIDIDDDL